MILKSIYSEIELFSFRQDILNLKYLFLNFLELSPLLIRHVELSNTY